MANDIRIRVSADTDQAERGLHRVGSRIEEVGETSKWATNPLEGLQKAFLGIATVTAAGAFLKGAIGAAMEAQQTTQVLAVAVKNAGDSYAFMRGEIDRVTGSLSESTNFASGDQQAALASLVRILGDTRQALSVLPTVLDAAAASGNDLGTTANEVARFLTGQVNAVRSLGIEMAATATQTERLDALTAAIGGTAQASASQVTQFGNAWKDFQETFGKTVLPVLGEGLGVLSKLLDLGGHIVEQYQKAGRLIFDAQGVIDERHTQRIIDAMQAELDAILRIEKAERAALDVRRATTDELRKSREIMASIPGDWLAWSDAVEQTTMGQRESNSVIAQATYEIDRLTQAMETNAQKQREIEAERERGLRNAQRDISAPGQSDIDQMTARIEALAPGITNPNLTQEQIDAILAGLTPGQRAELDNLFVFRARAASNSLRAQYINAGGRLPGDDLAPPGAGEFGAVPWNQVQQSVIGGGALGSHPGNQRTRGTGQQIIIIQIDGRTLAEVVGNDAALEEQVRTQ